MNIYKIYDYQKYLLNYNAEISRQTNEVISLFNDHSFIKVPRLFQSGLNFSYRLNKDYKKQSFNIKSFTLNDSKIIIEEEIIENKTFCNLLKFERYSNNQEIVKKFKQQKNLLIIAPLSGHYATLLKDTVEACIKDYNVYITDWKNARDISMTFGNFGLDTYIDYAKDFISIIDNVSVLAVCQSTVPTLAAVSLMAEDNLKLPENLILMAGPIDTRENPTKVNNLAKEKDISWFKKTLIHKVPSRYLGSGRNVYPGFLQLTAFVSMNPKKHASNYIKYFYDHLKQNDSKIKKHEEFYDEYNAVLDMDAKYYLDTVEEVFQKHSLALGSLKINDKLISPEKIINCKLLTIEGEKDDICGIGQTYAAHNLCKNIKEKKHHVASGVGHYGVFSGKRWREEIYPIINDYISKED